MMVDECDVYSLALTFDVYFQNLSSTTRVHDIKIHVTRGMIRKIMLFIGKKPKGRSIMISISTNPLKESRKRISIGTGCRRRLDEDRQNRRCASIGIV